MRKRYSPNFKAQVVLEILKEEKTISQLASEHGIHPNQLYKWKNQVLENLPYVFPDGNRNLQTVQAGYEKKIEDLYAEIGRLTMQLAWLKKKGFPVE